MQAKISRRAVAPGRKETFDPPVLSQIGSRGRARTNVATFCAEESMGFRRNQALAARSTKLTTPSPSPALVHTLVHSRVLGSEGRNRTAWRLRQGLEWLILQARQALLGSTREPGLHTHLVSAAAWAIHSPPSDTILAFRLLQS